MKEHEYDIEYMVVHSIDDIVEMIKFERVNVQIMDDIRAVMNINNCTIESNLR